MGDADSPSPRLLRRLGVLDAVMLVMGGIIGSGIFVTPAEVARHAQSPGLIVGLWVLGGAVAMAGALVYCELAARRPLSGGQYVYLRDAYGRSAGFLYGWSLLLVIQSGGMAAAAITFARYAMQLVDVGTSETVLALLTLACLTIINCLGVRAASNVQSALMLLKLLTLAALVALGSWAVQAGLSAKMASMGGGAPSLSGAAAALAPIMFAYAGWQTMTFVAGEMRNPRRDQCLGLLAGVGGVLLLYTAVAAVSVAALGPHELSQTKTPATAVVRLILGDRAGTWVAAGVAISTAGFLSQSMLTTPRVYHAMAADGVFFRSIANVNSRTHAPILAILLQGGAAMAIALSGTYDQILGYVISTDFLWFALAGAAVFIFRRREGEPPAGSFRIPGHPITTAAFTVACATIVMTTVYSHPVNSAVGYAFLAIGYLTARPWLAKRARTSSQANLAPEAGAVD